MSRSVVTGDFNNDGLIDLVATRPESGPARGVIALGRSDGTFAPAVLSGAQGEALVAGDFNNDGNLDLVTALLPAPDETVTAFRGNGNGIFTHAGDIVWYYETAFVATADFNRDGKLDIAISGAAESTESGVAIVLGNGDLTFDRDAGSRIYVPTGRAPAGLVAADLDADGRTDIAVANSGSNTVSLLFNRGTLLFTQSHLSFDRAPRDVTAADVNRDGRMDLIVAGANGVTPGYDTPARFGPGRIYVLFGQGNGSFALPRAFDAGEGTWHAATGDFNRDGRLDIATVNRSSRGFDPCTNTTIAINTVAVLPGYGNGSFARASIFALGDQRNPRGVIGGWRSLTVADVNRDGHRDIVASHGDMFLTRPPDPNWAPTVNAGLDSTVSATTRIIVRASVEEPDLDAVTYAWSRSDGRSMPGQRAVCVGTLPPGSYTFTVSVSDRHGHTATDSVTYTVVP